MLRDPGVVMKLEADDARRGSDDSRGTVGCRPLFDDKRRREEYAATDMKLGFQRPRPRTLNGVDNCKSDDEINSTWQAVHVTLDGQSTLLEEPFWID